MKDTDKLYFKGILTLLSMASNSSAAASDRSFFVEKEYTSYSDLDILSACRFIPALYSYDFRVDVVKYRYEPEDRRPQATKLVVKKQKLTRTAEVELGITADQSGGVGITADADLSRTIPISETNRRVLLGQVYLNKEFKKSYAAEHPVKKPSIPNMSISSAWHAVSWTLNFAFDFV